MTIINSENSLGKKLQEDFCNFCDKAAIIFNRFPFLRDSEQALQELQKSIRRPFNLAILGRMKTGKSTLINALVGENLAITGVEETTATINVISYASSTERLGEFSVHWKNSPVQTYPLSELQSKWSGKTHDVLENVRNTSYIQLYSSLEFLKLCEIIDTPGTGSEVVEHENITQNFLEASLKKGADAIIYVCSPIGRESDVDNIEKFIKNNCLPNSNPYNSVSVLHKWDHIYWENGGNITDIKSKAQRVFSAMSSLVADVIPVSAPLALAAIKAPDDFFNGIKDLCNNTPWEELQRLLNRDIKWNRDPERKKILNLYSLPWPTFQNIVREIAFHIDEFTNLIEIRKHLKELSGIDQLLLFLDRNFFKNSEIIRQKQKYAEIYRIKQQTYNLIQKRMTDLSDDIESLEILSHKNIKESNIISWIEKKHKEALKEKEDLQHYFEQLDSTFLNSSIPLLIQDDETIRWCEEILPQGKILSQQQFNDIKAIFSYLSGDKTALSQEVFANIEHLHTCIAKLTNHPLNVVRNHAAHIRRRIEFLLHIYQNEGIL